MSNWHKNWFSNMLPFETPLVVDGISYRTVEHYYQAMKLDDLTQRKEIAAMGPFEAKKVLNSGKYKIRSDWNDDKKLEVMEYALRWKFAPGTSWYEKLMDTDGDIIEWNNWGDVWWGKDLETGKGRNELGKLLMNLRAMYQMEAVFN
jgi:ribA/ribD-fused uncharacterized protein